jgi:hydrophobe/amphiphile efflux-1 (HAE1) family protein
MLSGFFIERPIFASVLSILITVAGGVAVFSLPIAQYPEITPPTVQVSCNYPGADAQVVADTVAAPIEQQVNGVENMLYMSSQSGNDGSYTLTVTFDLGTDLNSALVLVQNRVSLAMPQLPNVVQRQGVTVKKKSPNILLCINFISPGGRYDDLYLSNYATIRVKDELARVEGVGDVTLLGERDYSIRLWLDPQQLSSRNLTASDVTNAVQRQNIPLSAGAIGQQPCPGGTEFQVTLNALGRLAQPEEFADIVVKTLPADPHHPAARLVRLGDVARVELGAQQYNELSELDGVPTVTMAVYQLPGANALDTGQRVRQKMEELRKRFPEGLEYRIVHDTTPFIEESVREVFRTLRDAMALVAVVVLLFLQNWRATIIPLIAVPVAIVGTFAAMAAMGFSLNNISLFGLVLAIGIVVDDAIVVVENVERWLAEGLSPRDAARKAMEEVTGPVVAVALVLCAVFVPCAFISGITGQFFRQFAVTIAVSTVISAFNSLTLSPALAAILLRPHGAARDPVTRLLDAALGGWFGLFNRAFQRGTTIYARLVGGLLRTSAIVLVLYGGLLWLTSWSFQKMPQGFIPLQDQGYLLVNVQLPDSASVQRTHEVMKRIEQIAHRTPGVAHTISISGYSILLGAGGSNFGSMFVILYPFSQRTTRELNGFQIFFKLRRALSASIREAMVGVFPAPPVNGLGTAGGFKLMVEDRAARGFDDLQRQTDGLIHKASAQPGLVGLFTMFRAATAELFVDVDRVKAKSMGVSLNNLFGTMQINLGSLYVNNFNQFGRSWQVNAQADQQFRNRTDAVRQLKVRSASGKMVPLGTLADVRESCGPSMVTRYNLYAAAPINGNLAPGMSTGQAISLLDGMAAATLPRSMKAEWTELTYMQIRAGNTAMIVFGLAVVFVFLVLSALYESWSLPLAVILVVPMCLLCSVAGVASVPHMDINIFTQIGFVVLVGLASKNAILIVEFAKQLRDRGEPLREATTQACRLRLRPIVMTSLAFILGVVPLLTAGGAGSEMRRTLGIAVFSGMLGVTLFGILLTPVFFYVIQGIGGLAVFRRLQSPQLRRVAILLVNLATLGIPALLLAVIRAARRGGPTTAREKAAPGPAATSDLPEELP